MKNRGTQDGLRRQTSTLASALALVPIAVAVAQTPESGARIEPARTDVALDVYVAPRAIELGAPTYPLAEQLSGNEGWVNVNFMVDPQGKPYEVMVSQSSGNKSLEQAALRAAEKWTLQPAMLNGQPIDASHEVKVHFTLTEMKKGASPQFAKQYRALAKAIDAKDKAVADVAMTALHAKNLYEDAYYGLANFHYANSWGTEAQQIAGLKRAIARERKATYLPKNLFLGALQTLLGLQVSNGDFAGAMETWERLQAAGAADEVLDRIKPAIARIDVLRSDDRTYAVAGELVDGSWNLGLFKKSFSIRVLTGHVSQIKLRCDRKYVFFAFDPELQYRVADSAGKCGIQVLGDPDTKFELVQS